MQISKKEKKEKDIEKHFMYKNLIYTFIKKQF